MKILVTGATGFIGSHIARELHSSGYEVQVLVRSPEKVSRTPAICDLNLGVLTGNVTDRASVKEALAGCDGAVHCAALVALDEGSADVAYETNVSGTENVIGQTAELGIPAIHISTVSLFGNSLDRVAGSSPLQEPTGVYARSKFDAELRVRELQDSGAPIKSVYPTGVLGPDSPDISVVHQALKFWLGVPPKTTGGVSIVDARDLAQAVARLFQIKPPTNRYIVGGWYLRWEHLTRVLERVTARRMLRVPLPGPVLRGTGKAGDWLKKRVSFDFPWTYEAMETATRAPQFDSSPAVRDLGIRFRPAEETFADSIRWMAQRGELTEKQAGQLAP